MNYTKLSTSASKSQIDRIDYKFESIESITNIESIKWITKIDHKIPNNSCDQIYIFGYILRPHMGTFKLHISCTQAMCSLQYRLHMQHAKDIQRRAAFGRPPLCILKMLHM